MDGCAFDVLLTLAQFAHIVGQTSTTLRANPCGGRGQLFVEVPTMCINAHEQKPNGCRSNKEELEPETTQTFRLKMELTRAPD